MKIAIITDTHFGVRGDSQIFADYFKKFYDNVFFPYLLENNINTLFHLGDIVERRKYINFVTANRLESDLVRPLAEYGINVKYVIGNHDAYYKNTNEINAMTQLYGNREYKNMTIVTMPTEFDFDGCRIVLMPWICTDNMKDAFDLISNTKAQILMGHLELAGFEMNKGAVIDHGMDAKIFEKFDLVCSGHYHHKSTKGNINYLGCPYEITWSDYDDPKGFHVFDTDTRKLEFVRNPYTMFNKIYYNDNDIDQETLDRISGTYVKVIVKSKSNLYLFDRYIDTLEKANPAFIQIVDDNLNLQLEDDDEIINNAEDTLTILKKYVSSIESTTDINKNKVESFLSELYSEAINL